MTEPMKTAEDLKQEILPWVRGADRYNLNLESHLEYATNEIVKLSELYAAQQVSAERERIKKELGKFIVEHEYELDFPGDPVINVSVLFKLIDSL